MKLPSHEHCKPSVKLTGPLNRARLPTTRRPPYVGEGRLTLMDLNSATWMVRTLDQPVSALHITSENEVFACGWDGRLTLWDDGGEHLWTAQTNDRISAVALSEKAVVVASGLHIVCLDRASGEAMWSVALEGSADEVVWWQGELVAVSSVYDIEHNDFIESAVWRLSPEGDVLWVERMDERPWALVQVGDRLLAGLGRPRCGCLDVSSKPPFSHTDPTTPFPTTSGSTGQTRGLFGQTDGTVTDHEGVVLSTESGAVEHLTCMVKGYVATTDSGHAVGRTDDGEACWEAQGAPVSAQAEAMEHDGASQLWVARNEGVGSVVNVWASNNSQRQATGQFSRVRAMHGTPQRAAIGCEDGSVVVWDRDMLLRRLDSGTTPAEPVDERTSALQAKLRALRK